MTAAAKLPGTADKELGMGRKPQPRTLMSEPKNFGRKARVRFRCEDFSWGLVAGAREQHVFAWEMHHFAEVQGLPLGEVAELTGIEYQRLSRVLGGTAWMSMEDQGRMAAVFPEAFGRRTGPRSRYPSPEVRHLRMVVRNQRRLRPKTSLGEDVVDDLEWPDPTDWHDSHESLYVR